MLTNTMTAIRNGGMATKASPYPLQLDTATVHDLLNFGTIGKDRMVLGHNGSRAQRSQLTQISSMLTNTMTAIRNGGMATKASPYLYS